MASITVNMPHSGGTKDFTYNFTCDGGVVSFQKHNNADTWYSFTANTTTKTVTVSAQTWTGTTERTAILDAYVDGNLCSDKDTEIKQKPNDVDWLTFTFTTAGTLKFTPDVGVYPRYSKNGGAWTTITSAGVSAANGDVIRLRGPQDHVGLAIGSGGIGEFYGTSGKYTVGGKVATLLYDDLVERADSYFDTTEYAFELLFYDCGGLISIDDLKFPLIVGRYCYEYMFQGCTGLTSVPSGLLPAKYLAYGCYMSMFGNCTSLTKAPILPAENLAEDCYADMFTGCTSLNEITCLATMNISRGTSNWVDDVASSGTFKCKSAATWPSGDNGIPNGWTRVNV